MRRLLDRFALWRLKRSALKIARKAGSDRVIKVDQYFDRLAKSLA